MTVRTLPRQCQDHYGSGDAHPFPPSLLLARSSVQKVGPHAKSLPLDTHKGEDDIDGLESPKLKQLFVLPFSKRIGNFQL